MSRGHRLLCWTVLAAGVILSAYGFREAKLFDQTVWSEIGKQRFLGWAAAYTLLAGALVCWRPRWLLTAIVASSIIYTALAVGPAAPLTVCFLLVSLALTGGVLPGFAVLVTLISLTAALPVHYPWVYAAALCVPIALRRERAWQMARAAMRPPSLPRADAAACAIALFPFLSHWLVALKPEASADGLAMHLVIPMRMAVEHRWAFDVGEFLWAVMPMGGDFGFTAAYLLGGEAAARLLNLALLGIVAGTVYVIFRRWVSRAAALLLCALFLSSPMVQSVTGSLFVENLWAAMVLGAVLEILRFGEDARARHLYVAAMLAGVAVNMKLAAAVFAVALLAFAGVELMRRPSRHWLATLFAAPAVCLAFASIPYVTALRLTGNPVFPFAGDGFKSALYGNSATFDMERYRIPVSLASPYDFTFHTSRHLEAQNGGFAFHWFLLLPLAGVLLGRRWPRPAVAITVVVLFTFFIVLSAQSYGRYIYPLLPLAMAPLAIAWSKLGDRPLRTALSACGGALFVLNLAFLPASGRYHKDFFLNQAFDPSDVDRYITSVAPTRRLVAYVNSLPGDHRVGFLEGNAVAGLRGRAFSNTWHSDAFLRALRDSASPQQDYAVARQFGLDYVIAKNAGPSLRTHTPAFLHRYTEPVLSAGDMHLARVRREDEVAAVSEAEVAPPQSYDDPAGVIFYSGPWVRDNQFPQSSGGTLTYTNHPGSSFSVRFTGSALTWVHTKAANRGRAAIEIDGQPYGVLDQYSPATIWRAEHHITGLGPGAHTLTATVLPDRDAGSSDVNIDVDELRIARQ